MVLPVWFVNDLTLESSLAVVPQSLYHVDMTVVSCVKDELKPERLR